ncbi:MAG: ATP-binding protein [Planctomycetaceae bacterium]|nr:ATP-binding protein [Planctomycetaceae bacterium]
MGSRITVGTIASPSLYIIRDEGPGFDPSLLPDPTAPANLERASGRGLLLIRALMDEVAFNAAGNQITMTKRRPGPPDAPHRQPPPPGSQLTRSPANQDAPLAPNEASRDCWAG